MLIVPPFLPVGLHFLESLRQQTSRIVQTETYMRLLQSRDYLSGSRLKDERLVDVTKRRPISTGQDHRVMDQVFEDNNADDTKQGEVWG